MIIPVVLEEVVSLLGVLVAGVLLGVAVVSLLGDSSCLIAGSSGTSSFTAGSRAFLFCKKQLHRIPLINKLYIRFALYIFVSW